LGFLGRSPRNAIGAIVVAAALTLPAAANAFDHSKYPDMQAQWSRPRGIGIQWDPSKPDGRAQQPPLTTEYQATWEASIADQANGGQDNDPLYRCFPSACRAHERGLPDGNHHRAEYHLHPVRLPRHRVASTPMGAIGPKIRNRVFSGTPMANG